MFVHLFNSSSVSGPERLVLPALARFPGKFTVVNLREERIERRRGADPLGEFARSLGLRYQGVLVRSRWDRAAIDELRRVLEEMNPALVHAHDVKASLYLLQSSGAARGFPLLSTHHGIHGRPDMKTRLYELLYRRRLNLFDRVLCVSSADHEALLESGIAHEKLRLHLNGIDGKLVTPAERRRASLEARRALLPDAADRDAFLFGAVGRLSTEKDHARMLRVLANLGPARPWLCLVLGAGPLEKSLRALARRLGLEKRVRWLGYRPGAAAEMAGLDLLLSFSKAEGLPISLVEAAWAGTPVMATRVGGVSDLLPDERHGSMVPPDEPVLETARRLDALMSPEGREVLRAQAWLFQSYVLKNFTQKHWTGRLGEIYAELETCLLKIPHPPLRGTFSQEEKEKSFPLPLGEGRVRE